MIRTRHNKFSYQVFGFVFVLMLALSFAGYAVGATTDFNGDGVVNFSDFAQMANAWQTTSGDPGFNSLYDFDHDGIIDLGDIAIFAEGWLGRGSYVVPDTNRVQLSFNAGWKFYKGTVSGDAASGSSYDDSSWLAVNLPHNPPLSGQSGPDAARPPWTPSGYSYEGVSWYRKHFTLDNSYQGRKIFIEFEAVSIRADIWVNGTLIPTTPHYGGYLPFTIDITSYVNFGGADNVIAVKADNTDDANTPIGNASWFNWGGIYRDAWLNITDNLHVTNAVYANTVADGGIFVTYPSVSESQAQVQVKTQIQNEYATSKNCTVATYIVDANNTVIARMANTYSIAAGSYYTFTQAATVNSPCLWHPYHPNLYTVYTEVYDGSNSIDTYSTRIGIKSISFSKAAGFQINGQPFKFMGTNRLQDFPYIGYAMGNVGQQRDAQKLREAGFEFVRTSHYPPDPAFLEACDELGIMVMDEIPGFQYDGGTLFEQRSYQNMRDMIRRDRNHPCVIAWELSLNEYYFTATYANNAYNIGHAEYPGNQCFVTGWEIAGTSYPDIYIATPHAGARTYSGSKPLIVDEYGEYEYDLLGNYYSDVHRGDIGSGYYGEAAMINQAANHQNGHNINLGMTYLCGDSLWVGIDYGPYPQGVLDTFRLPKFSYYFFQSQRDPNVIIAGIDSGPMVHIANYWTASSPTPVKVFSNCDQVALYLNNVLIATQYPDNDVNSTKLPHPPFTFTGLTFQSGTLTAQGLIGGQVVATHIVTTPGAATALSVAFDLDVNDVLPANGSETIAVNASIVDANGTLIPAASYTSVNFSVTGPATMASPAAITAEAGIATGYIRVTNQPGLITVTATASGLTTGNAAITSK
ncbi:MAG: glycoside hydrolase family 2 TIM barrel-domain containing protein [Sedimentisphaerales bacterium]